MYNHMKPEIEENLRCASEVQWINLFLLIYSPMRASKNESKKFEKDEARRWGKWVGLNWVYNFFGSGGFWTSWLVSKFLTPAGFSSDLKCESTSTLILVLMSEVSLTKKALWTSGSHFDSPTSCKYRHRVKEEIEKKFSGAKPKLWS